MLADAPGLVSYLRAIVDVCSRRVMAWRLSNTLTVDFCVAALEEALGRHGTPEIFNTDEARQFTSHAFIEVLEQAKVRISMDGRGRWVDNVFIERLGRSVKYEEVYLHAWETGAEAKAALGRYFAFYKGTRPLCKRWPTVRLMSCTSAQPQRWPEVRP